jgi:hypothetical protein
MHSTAPENKLLVSRQFFNVLLCSKLAVLEVFLPVNELFVPVQNFKNK